MPSWLNSNETSDDDDEHMSEFSSMQMEYFQTPNTVIDPSFCGLVIESERRCILHRQRPGKFVAFEGTDTGKRFIGCATENLGRAQDNEAHGIEVAKLKKELDSLANQYSQLVDDVSKLFDYQDGMKSHDMDCTSQAINELKEKKKQLEEQAKIELQMEKLKLKK
ncbi:hypothetical protein VPH35_059264 [Triticum aestivum]